MLVSNKITKKLFRAKYNISVFGLQCSDMRIKLENYPVKLILFQQAVSPRMRQYSRWGWEDFRVFSDNIVVNILKSHHKTLKAQLIREKMGFGNLCCEWKLYIQLGKQNTIMSVSVLIPKKSVGKPVISLTHVPKLAEQEQHPSGVSYSSLVSKLLC